MAEKLPQDRNILAEMLEAYFGEDGFDDSAMETARRVLAYWESFVPGPIDFIPTTFPSDNFGMVVVKDIEFASLCSHHLLPFYGVAHVAYLPHGKEIGLSKIPRIVEHFSHRPQVQERMTKQISGWIQQVLLPKGSMVVLEATHTCMSCRGILARNASMITSCPKGVFFSQPACRDEFFALIGGRK